MVLILIGIVYSGRDYILIFYNVLLFFEFGCFEREKKNMFFNLYVLYLCVFTILIIFME